MLPGINIEFQNGQLGQVVDLPDGVSGLLASAVAVGTTFLLNTPYQIRSMVDVAALGIIPDVHNYKLYKTLKEFYAEAGAPEGALFVNGELVGTVPGITRL